MVINIYEFHSFIHKKYRLSILINKINFFVTFSDMSFSFHKQMIMEAIHNSRQNFQNCPSTIL
ncbi:hypothetical protein DERP_001310 [Dermatophagoides pteronyssinus]|uniref:Uncharacterized protein n=1 Tax=Dermatophagoides pteronyssinus TaxID=6956 RepID=A0ABQ8JE34_DERPT|nr:hypothetical protein DERP_001310 [Dermatophagoides pteronyssinus]